MSRWLGWTWHDPPLLTLDDVLLPGPRPAEPELDRQLWADVETLRARHERNSGDDDE